MGVKRREQIPATILAQAGANVRHFGAGAVFAAIGGGGRLWALGQQTRVDYDTGSAPAIDEVKVWGFCVPNNMPQGLNLLAFSVFTAGPANSKARMGIYTNLPGDTYPNQLVAETGEIDVSTTGLKTAAVSAFTLVAGDLYWVAHHCSIGAATYRALADGNSGYYVGSHATVPQTPENCIRKTQAYAALPSTFYSAPTGFSSVRCPVLWVKKT